MAKRASSSKAPPVAEGRKPRPQRIRVCLDCGIAESIRTDNPSIICRRCCSVRGGLKAGAIRSAAAHLVSCSGCGVRFRRSRSNITEENFCTLECRTRARHLDRQCKQCGTGFRVYRSVVIGPSNASGNFCSRKCHHAWLLAGADKKAHFIQIKGPRRTALIRGRVCARCGTGDDIEVHHVVPRRVGGTDEPANILPLCGHCHSIIECITRDLIVRGIDLGAIATSIAPELLYA